MFNIAPIARVNNSVTDKIINLRLIIALSGTPKVSNHQERKLLLIFNYQETYSKPIET